MNYFAVVGLLLLAEFPANTLQYCTTVCMGRFQRSISEITGSQETSTLMAPFHKVISDSEDNKATYKQIKEICHKVKSWETCVRSCSRDSARAIVLSSMDQWKKFCAVMRKPTKANNEYLNCERDYLKQVSQKCEIYLMKTFSVAIFCKSLENYRVCIEQFVHRCSDEAMLIKKSIDEAIEQSFANLMRFATNRIRLPHKCHIWQRARPHHHRSKQLRGEIIHSTRTRTTTPEATIEPTTMSSPGVPVLRTHVPKLSENSVPCSCNNDERCSETCLSNVNVSATSEYLQSNAIMPDRNLEALNIENKQLTVNSYPHFQSLFFIFFIIVIFV